MFDVQNIFVYHMPQVENKIRIVVLCKNRETGLVKTKAFHIPFEQAKTISNRSWELTGNGHWDCSPYLFDCGSIGYHLSRK